MWKKGVSATVSRPAKCSQVETILYEIDMLQYCFGRLQSHHWTGEKDYYLCVEGFLLHYRNLIEFFGNRGGLRAGTPSDWSPKVLSDGEVRSIVNAKLIGEYRGLISRYLSHCDKIRAEKDRGWRHVEMYEKIEPLLVNFGKLFPSSPRPAVAAAGTNMWNASTASTSSYSPSLLDVDLMAAPSRKPTT